MGSTSEAQPGAAPPAEGPRPRLVTALAGVWFVFSALGGVGAVVVLSRSSSGTEQRIFAALSLLLAALFGAGAFGLLRRVSGARALLVASGFLALVVSGFSSSRIVTAASAPAASLAASEPDAANALALFRAGSAVGFLLSSTPLLVALGFLRHPSVGGWLGIPPRARKGPDVFLLVGAGALAVGGLSFFLSKKSPSSRGPARQAAAVTLGPAETFLWSDQPVVFSPPPDPFTRERHAEGGRIGVSFTRYAVPPTRITVAEAFLQPPPNTPEEALAGLRLTPASFRSADAADVGEPAPVALAGAPAFQTDYTIRERSMRHRGRELVVLEGRHVFVFTFLGRETDVPVFEALVGSASFRAPASATGAARKAGEEGAAAGAEPARGAEMRVGEHRVTVRVPDGFERVDYGARQEFRRGELRIALVDGGELPPGTGPANLEDEWLVQRALRLFGHDARRWDVAARTRVPAGDRDALVVDTHEKASHVFHTRTVVFVNGGRLMAGGMVMGVPVEGRDALDALARSVRFAP
jgi:hypothetical protein